MRSDSDCCETDPAAWPSWPAGRSGLLGAEGEEHLFLLLLPLPSSGPRKPSYGSVTGGEKLLRFVTPSPPLFFLPRLIAFVHPALRPKSVGGEAIGKRRRKEKKFFSPLSSFSQEGVFDDVYLAASKGVGGRGREGGGRGECTFAAEGNVAWHRVSILCTSRRTYVQLGGEVVKVPLCCGVKMA